MSDEAREYVKRNRRLIIDKFAHIDSYPSYEIPTVLFMAGSPGAGKTEVTLELIESLAQRGAQYVRIDGDEIRKMCPGYTGSNAHEFQSAASLGVEKLFDHIRTNRQNAIVDGTMAHLNAAKKNIERCVSKGHQAGIVYVYQDPMRAWEFTQKREILESRRIEKAVFIEAFINAPRNVNELKTIYGDKLKVFLVIKDYDNRNRNIHINIDRIENYLKKEYSIDELEGLL